ncbi:hypothetical protein [Bradyrhizobium sp. RT10b]|uniref:hypothetical protein n=1 Tax=Bradyrhizobium sp. RT10b TaxID=3156331 RepID=UPI0033916121
MSTIAKLIDAGTLKAVDLGLLDDELPERGLFGTARLHDFIERDLLKIESQDPLLSAEEQVANLCGRFLTNRPLLLKSPIAPIRCLKDGIWELKTLDVRIFGWFSAKDTMVVDAGCDVKLLKSGQLNYSGYIAQTDYVRRSLGFLVGDYILGDQPHDILTNFKIAPKPDRSALRGGR